MAEKMIRARIGLRLRGKHVGQGRCFSLPPVQSARLLLGLDPHHEVTPQSLRKAYLDAALKFHPDLQKGKDSIKFSKINSAYELLQSGVVPEQDLGITPDEDASFRSACESWLGLPGEVVEECKRCPMFREWLTGKSDGAIRWRDFLVRHGGLAPMLRQPAGLLEDLSEVSKTKERRKKR